MSKTREILSQIIAFLKKPNGGIIKIILRDGSTVIGLFKNNDNTNGFIELSNGRKVKYQEIIRIV